MHTESLRLTDRKRAAIVDAAIAEFRSNGFESTSMDRIAASAGVSKRTVYNHFPSKDELFAEILTRLWQASMATVQLEYDSSKPLREQLENLLWQKMRLLNDTNFIDLARVAIAETIHAPERAQAMVAKLGEEERGVTGWIRAAIADGRLKQVDPQFASHLIQGQLKTFAFWHQVTMGQPPLTEGQQKAVITTALDMFLAHFAN
jgi:TetR/AcrR family transcriptional regulator of autoinduction and epiphytic fitness